MSLIDIRNTLREELLNSDNPSGLRAGMLYAVSLIDDEIKGIAGYVQETLWHYDYDTMDWSQYTHDQLYEIHLKAEQEAYDGDAYCDVLRKAIPLPPPPTKHMSYDLWVETYKPHKNNDGTIMYLVANNKEMVDLPKKYPNCVWTEMNEDGGGMIVNEAKFINRISYVITKIPYKAGEIIEVSMESGNNE